MPMSAYNKKDESIARMLNELRAELGADAFDVVDHWESDTSAIGIARRDDHGVLVYVSTYGRNSNQYWVSLEFPPRTDDSSPYVPAGERVVHGVQELVSVVRSHFGAKNA